MLLLTVFRTVSTDSRSGVSDHRMRAPCNGHIHVPLGPVFLLLFFPMVRKNIPPRLSNHILSFRGEMWFRCHLQRGWAPGDIERLDMLRFAGYSDFRSLSSRAHGNIDIRVLNKTRWPNVFFKTVIYYEVLLQRYYCTHALGGPML